VREGISEGVFGKGGGRRGSRGRTAGGEIGGSEDGVIVAFPFLQGLPKLACFAKALTTKCTYVVGGGWVYARKKGAGIRG